MINTVETTKIGDTSLTLDSLIPTELPTYIDISSLYKLFYDCSATYDVDYNDSDVSLNTLFECINLYTGDY
jgi:hypothetical protein